MTSLLLRTFPINTSKPSFRFISSLNLTEDHRRFQFGREDDPEHLNPFHIFYNQSKTEKPTIRDIKKIHSYAVKSGIFVSDIFVANSLTDLYCKSSKMGDAQRLFAEIPDPNIISWNLMISGYNQSSEYEKSWKMFCRMHAVGLGPNQFTYGSVLSACAALQDLKNGKQVYTLVFKNGFFSDGYVRTGMIDLFAKSSLFEEALRAFQDVPCENVVCWNAIIAAAVRNGDNWVALDLFQQMLCGFSMPNGFTFSSVLTACAALRELDMGQRVHGRFIKCGIDEDVFVGTAIVDLYAKCGVTDEAIKKFSRMQTRNVVSWTAIISGLVQKDESTSALQFFREMRVADVEINNFTITSALTACSRASMSKEAVQVHSWILKAGFYSDSTIRDSLINMYSKMGEIGLSEMVFEETRNSNNLRTWAVMISGFAQNHNSVSTTKLFKKMYREGLKPDTYCCSSVLSILDCVLWGAQIHCYILKFGLVSDVSVGSALFTMYSKCGSLNEAYDVFEAIQEKDEVSWTSMIAGFAEHGCADRAFRLFQEMVHQEIRPDQMTLSAILTACCVHQSLQKGKEIHGYALRRGVFRDMLIGGSLVNMYSKCKSLSYARKVFELMPQKDHVSLCSLISGYAQSGCSEDALLVFHEMLVAGLEMDSFTIASLLGMSATLANPSLGKQLHTQTVKMDLGSDVSVGSSLVTMYSKCGSIDDSRKVFDRIQKPDLVTWTAMIVGYAQHGKGEDALRVYELMREKKIKPDSVTFVGVLSACSHSGLVEEGYFHLNSMSKNYGIEPGLRHYACIVDLLGRSGRLKEAKSFIDDMHIEPDALVWGTLLAACRLHGDVELGKLAAIKVLELEPCDSGAYVSLSNILADVGEWEEVSNIRRLMKRAGVNKDSGWSSV